MDANDGLTLGTETEWICNLTWMARRVAGIIRRSIATDLDPRAYAGLWEAGRALQSGFRARRRWSARPYRRDTDFVSALVALEADLVERVATVEVLIDAWEDQYELVASLRARDMHREARRLAARIDDALAALYPLLDRLWNALAALRCVYDELEDTYQDVYDLVRAGHVLPHNAKWITGEDPSGLPPQVSTYILRVAAKLGGASAKAR